jgi:hypothetical protein
LEAIEELMKESTKLVLKFEHSKRKQAGEGEDEEDTESEDENEQPDPTNQKQMANFVKKALPKLVIIVLERRYVIMHSDPHGTEDSINLNGNTGQTNFFEMS